MSAGLNFDSTPHDEIDVDGGLFDGGWYLLPTRSGGYTNSGGTVTYTATTVADSAASFGALSTPYDVNVRALPVLESGSTGVTYSTNYLDDPSATFVTALVKPGHIVRTAVELGGRGPRDLRDAAVRRGMVRPDHLPADRPRRRRRRRTPSTVS